MAPLADLRPRLGVFAVLGNHDHWRDAAEARAALDGVGIRVLDNEAAQAGPLAIGGLDDDFTGQDDRAGDAGGDAPPARGADPAEPQPGPVPDGAAATSA